MFGGALPEWIGDLLSVLGLPAILLAIVVWVLNKKQANRKLVVDEGTLKRSEFETFTEAQNQALTTAKTEAKEAKAEVTEVSDRLDVMDELYDGMRENLIRLRSLLRKIVAKNSYTMTEAELHEFESTKPLPRPPRNGRT